MHMAWLIIKIILLTLGILLGIALILLVLLLFVPVRYQIDAACHPEETGGTDHMRYPQVKARVSWMSFFLDLRAQYKEGVFRYELRSFWALLAASDESKMKELFREKRFFSGNRHKKKERTGRDRREGAGSENIKDIEDVGDIGDIEETEEIPVIDTAGFKASAFFDADDYEPWEADEQERAGKSGDAGGADEAVWISIRRFFRGLQFVCTLPARIVAGIHFVWSKLRSVMDHVTAALERLLKKLRRINKKRTQIMKLWELPTTKTAYGNCKRYVLDLLVHLKPRTVSGSLVIGFKDPSVTGKFFGILGLLLPIYYDNIDITADFARADEPHRMCVEGDIHIKGGITIFYLLCLLLKIYRDKYTMKTYERVKKILGGN